MAVMAAAPTDDTSGQSLAGSLSAEDLFDHALPRIYGYILVRVGGDRAVAEDLTQETMLALARTLANPETVYCGSDCLAFWGGSLQGDRSLPGKRRAGVVTPWAGDDESDEPGDLDPDLEAIVERDELLSALDRLAAGQRLALVLHYADGLSAAEIGDLLGKSGQAVDSLLARGRRVLWGNLDRAGDNTMKSDRNLRSSFKQLDAPGTPDPEYAATLRSQFVREARVDATSSIAAVASPQRKPAPLPKRRRWFDLAAAAVLLLEHNRWYRPRLHYW